MVLHSDAAHIGALALKTAGGEKLGDDERRALLERSLAGEHIELLVEIRPFSQERGAQNRNFVRFKESALVPMGRSGVGSVFLRDHRQGDQMARGGTIVASKMEKAEPGKYELVQTAKLVKPWAVQGALDGTIDRFSIGWHPTGNVLCTACKASVMDCWHYPGQSLQDEKSGAAMVVEFEFQAAELVETSAVAVPAVKGTGVVDIRAALGLQSNREVIRMSEENAPTVASNIDDTAKIDAAAKAAALAATQAERTRAAAIRTAGVALKVSDEFIKAHLDKGTTADDFRALAIDEYAAAHKSPVADHGRPHLEMGETSDEKFRATVTASLLQRFGAGVVVALRGKGYDIAAGDKYRGHSLVELARECLNRAGVSTKGKTKMELLGLANTLSGNGYQATGDWPVAFEEALHKALEMRAELSDLTWRRFCSTGTLTDFRPHRLYRMGEMGTWAEVLENGEYKRIVAPDALRETVTAKKRGNIVAITREAMINDDMDFITEQINSFVDGGLYTVEYLVYQALAENGGLGPNMSDGNPLFHATHKNIGTGAALSVASLDADRVLMRRQKDINGQRFLQLRPSVLVIASELYGTALTINEAEFDQDAVAPNSTNKFRVPNKVRGMLSDIVDAPELSGTRRYMFADPMRAPVMHVGFLEGVQTPTIESQDGWNVDGTEYKGRYEFGVGVRDWRGAVTNAGA